MKLGLALRRLRGRHQHEPGRGRCMHCSWPWGDGDRTPRSIWYDDTNGIFVVCKWCWPHVDEQLLMRYAATLVLEIWPAAGMSIRDCALVWPNIRDACVREKSGAGGPGDEVRELMNGIARASGAESD